LEGFNREFGYSKDPEAI
jgi:hypothetical protein